MPQVTTPTGASVNVPQTLNGQDLKKALNIPPNHILTKTTGNQDEVVRNSDDVTVQEGDRFDSLTPFERG
jgi:hypothetical protein